MRGLTSVAQKNKKYSATTYAQMHRFIGSPRMSCYFPLSVF